MAEELKQFKDEIIRHFDVVAEDLKHEIQLVAEGVSTANERIDRMQGDISSTKKDVEIMQVDMATVKMDVEIMQADMATVKMDVEFIKNELIQKVSREEFAFLEKRVGSLENKVSHAKE